MTMPIGLTQEEIKARCAQRYQENKEKAKERASKWYRSHIEQAREYHAKYRLLHREKRREQGKKWRLANLEKVKASYAKHMASRTAEQICKHKKRQLDWRLKKTYGITLAQREQMLISQGGGCAICGTPDFGSKGPCVDHDHQTGVARSLLCHNCNATLGLIKESIETAKNIICYLTKNSCGLTQEQLN
jgi:hypothetical protein